MRGHSSFWGLGMEKHSGGLDGSIPVWGLLHPGLGSSPLLLCARALPARDGVAGSTGAWGGLGEGAEAGVGVLWAAPPSAWHPRDGTALTQSLPTGC